MVRAGNQSVHRVGGAGNRLRGQDVGHGRIVVEREGGHVQKVGRRAIDGAPVGSEGGGGDAGVLEVARRREFAPDGGAAGRRREREEREEDEEEALHGAMTNAEWGMHNAECTMHNADVRGVGRTPGILAKAGLRAQARAYRRLAAGRAGKLAGGCSFVENQPRSPFNFPSLTSNL